MSEAWADLEDVVFDDATADSFAAACRGSASTIRGQEGVRSSAVEKGSTDFEGLFSRLFATNATTAATDADEIATRLDEVASHVDYLQEEARKEQQRRETARAWAQEQADKSGLDKFADGAAEVVTLGFADTGDKPEGPQSSPPPKTVEASTRPRDVPMPDSGGGAGGAGTSSARPANLRDFASTSRGSNGLLEPGPARLRGLAADFAAECQYGEIDASGVFAAFEAFNAANDEDVRWATQVADAFDRAGSEGDVATLSDSALFAVLAAAGVDATRDDIVVEPPRTFGMAPSSGYVDDPVNAATGSFVELESDLGFAGGCATLQLTRTYNSFDRGSGAFGAGWSSWTEVSLVLDDESARLTLPDGRQVVFPRLGAGWDQASGESMWLERDDAADELRATDNDGLTWRFGAAGVPLSRDRGEGTMVGFVHDGPRLVRMEHERGRHVTLVWEGDRVVAAETSDGRTVRYRYDGDRLVAADGPSGVRTYRWDEAGLVDAVIDPDGVVEVENTYDEQARVTSQRSRHGRTSRYVYLPGDVTVVSDPDGTRSNTWVSDRRGRLVGIVDSEGNRQSTSYDAAGNPVLVTERDGSATVREFDDRGRMVREVRPSGADLSFTYDEQDRVVEVLTEDGARTTCSYEGTSRNPSVLVDPEGGRMRLEWVQGRLVGLLDPTGVRLRFGYDEHGDLVSVTDAVGGTTTVERDAAGRTVASTTPAGHRTTFVHGPRGLEARHDPDGAVWRFEHTAAGRLAAVVDPLGARTTIEHGDDGEERRRIDPLGRSTRRHLDDLGNLAGVELPDGSTWRFGHDALSRLVETTTPDGRTWERSYDEVGALVGTRSPTGEQVAVSTDRALGTVVAQDAAGTVTHRFDALGRPVSTELPDGSVAVATYDRRGLPVELLDGEGGLTRIERDAGGRPVAVTSPAGAVTRFEHDACGRRSAVVDPLGARTTIEYDADSRPVRVVLPTGDVARTRYDACGRVVETHVPGRGTTRFGHDAAGRVVEARDGRHGRRSFLLDAAGQVVAATDANGGTTRYEHDVRGRVVAVTDPLGHVTRREFDTMDRCVAETDPLGRTTRAGYDAAGRQAWQEDAQGHRTEWRYDDTGRVAGVSIDGRPVARITRDARRRTVRLTDHTRPDGRTVEHEAEYDGRGLLVRRSRDDQTLTWSHDAAGRRTRMTLPDGGAVDYAHDAAGRLVAVDHPLLGRATLEHDAAGQVVRATAGGVVQSWTYRDGLVVGHTRSDGAGATTVERDEDGRIVAVEHDGTATTFDHDAACQLVEARTGSAATRWRYDAAGRLTRESSPAGTRELTYDEAGQLLSDEGPAGTTRHDHDELGRRVRTVHPDGRTRDLGWSPTGWLATVVDTGSDVARTELHVDAAGELASVDGVPLLWDSAVPYAPPLAQVGTTPVVPAGPVTGIGDTWATPGWRTPRTAAADDVWATATLPAVPGLPDGLGLGPSGALTVGDLEWLGARVYDAAARGFLSADPLDPVTGAGWAGNRYSYAGNDPLHALDPTGLKPITEAELAQMNAPWAEQAWDASAQWVEDNTDYLIGGGLVLLGAGAMFIPGAGPILGPALISAGADVISQRIAAGKDGQINWGQVAVSGAAGAIGGGSGMMMKNAVTAGTMTATQAFGRTVLVESALGGTSSVASYALDEKSDFTVGGAFLHGTAGVLTGGHGAVYKPLSDAAGTAAARQLGAVIPDGAAADVAQLTWQQTLAKNAGGAGVDMVVGAENSVLDQALKDQDLDGGKLLRDTLMGGGKSFVSGSSGDFDARRDAANAPAPVPAGG